MPTANAPSDVLFLLLGAIMILAMHAGFAFLELGTVRKKNQVNALVKILTDFAVSAIAYFFVGYTVAYGVNFLGDARHIAEHHGYELVKFFFLLTFAAAIPAIVSGGIAERAKFHPQSAATFLLVGLVYPFFEGIAWNNHYGVQDWLSHSFGQPFHDFAGSVVVHAVGGWIGLAAVLNLGARRGRYSKEGRISAHPPSSIPFLALGAWILIVGWFGFNVMSAQRLDGISGLVAINSLMAMVGGTLSAMWAGKNDPASSTTARWPAWWRCVPVRTSCIRWVRWWWGWWPAACLSGCSPRPRTAGRLTTCWGYGRCMASVVPGVALPPVFLARAHWVAWAASAWCPSCWAPWPALPSVLAVAMWCMRCCANRGHPPG
jgi:hypothetical protein